MTARSPAAYNLACLFILFFYEDFLLHENDWRKPDWTASFRLRARDEVVIPAALFWPPPANGSAVPFGAVD